MTSSEDKFAIDIIYNIKGKSVAIVLHGANQFVNRFINAKQKEYNHTNFTQSLH
jgi:hypothetical protein